ncbi:helix-turn-helix transcriptional regulator [Brachybacterium phenoliresistens]|uniref:helix-turn-helix transcriptional regulator n=1 Tax=Brachybacterium phenoliresistens TaxID=396014 RepID=UPI0031D92EFF
METRTHTSPALGMDDSRGRAARLLAEIEEIRESTAEDRLAGFLDTSYFAACLLVPDALEELLAAMPSRPDPLGARNALARTFLHADAPVPVHASVQFGRWYAQTTSPGLRDRLGMLLLRLQQQTFDGRHDLAVRTAEELTVELNSAPDRSGIQDFLPAVLIGVGSAHLQAGSLDAAVGSYRSAARWAEAGSHPAHEHAESFVELVRALRADGCPHEARRRIAPVHPRGARSSLLWIWTCVAVLARGLRSLAAGDLHAAQESLERIGLGPEGGDADALGQYWWVPLHLRAGIALRRGDRDREAHLLRRGLEEHFPSVGPTSYAGSLLRADLADLLQACHADSEAAAVLDEAERGVPTSQVLASRARLLHLTGDDAGLDRLLERTGRFHPLSSPELDVLRLLRRHARLPRQAPAAEDHDLWRAVMARAGDLELSLLPAEAAAASAPDGETPRPVGSGPFSRPDPAHLSRAERDLVATLRADDTIASVAQRMYLSPHTVKTRLRDIYRKLGVHSKEELFEHRGALLHPPP